MLGCGVRSNIQHQLQQIHIQQREVCPPTDMVKYYGYNDQAKTWSKELKRKPIVINVHDPCSNHMSPYLVPFHKYLRPPNCLYDNVNSCMFIVHVT
jgi:hypothetical protein